MGNVVEIPTFTLLAIGLVISFAFTWAFRTFWNATLGPAFRRLADIGFGGVHGIGAVHPLGFLKTVDTNVMNWTNRGLQSCEQGIVYSINKLIDSIGLFFGVPLAIALALYELATWAKHKIGHAVTRIEHTTVIKKIGTATKVITSVTRAQYNSLVHRVDALGARVAHLAHAIPHGVVALPGRVGITSKQLRRLERRTHALEKKTVGLGAVALVTAALVRMGFKWVKCDSAKRVGRRLNCGSFQFLESLLSLAVEALIITNLCQTTKLLTRLGVAAQPLIVKLTTGVADLMRCQGAGALLPLPLASFSLPDVEGDGLPL